MTKSGRTKKLPVFILFGVFIVLLSLITSLILVTRNLVFNHSSSPETALTANEKVSTVSQQIAKISADGQEATVDVTGGDIETLLSDKANDVISQPAVTIDQKTITIHAKAKPLWGLGFTLRLSPEVKQSELFFNVYTAKIAFIDLPQSLRNQLTTITTEAISQELSDKVVVKDAELRDNMLEIKIQKGTN